jgi:hypothetical protein
MKLVLQFCFVNPPLFFIWGFEIGMTLEIAKLANLLFIICRVYYCKTESSNGYPESLNGKFKF